MLPFPRKIIINYIDILGICFYMFNTVGYQPASTTTEPITQPSSTTLSTLAETSTQPSTSTTTKTSTLSSIDSSSTKYTTISISTETTSNPTTIEPSPCRDLNKINMFILPCIGPVFSFISSTKNSTHFCGYVHYSRIFIIDSFCIFLSGNFFSSSKLVLFRLMMRVFDCIVNKTEIDGNVTCSSDDKKELMEAIGLQMNQTLPLPFSPDLCEWFYGGFFIYKKWNHDNLCEYYVLELL